MTFAAVTVTVAGCKEQTSGAVGHTTQVRTLPALLPPLRVGESDLAIDPFRTRNSPTPSGVGVVISPCGPFGTTLLSYLSSGRRVNGG